MGEGQSPSIEHLAKLGLESKIDQRVIEQVINQTKEALSHWENLAAHYGVSKVNIKLIKGRISL